MVDDVAVVARRGLDQRAELFEHVVGRFHQLGAVADQSMAAACGARIDAALAEIYHATGEPRLAQQYYEAARSKAERGQPVNPARMNKLKQALAENAT